MCDDDCPRCGARDMTPYDSEDLTEVIEQQHGEFIVVRSPDTAEDKPRYEEVERFDTINAASAYLAIGRTLRKRV